MEIRNIAIIAHVDHGKTTLVDQFFKQSGMFRDNQSMTERLMDSMDLERERGITVTSAATTVEYKGYQINLKFNKCLTCHSWANYEQSGATKISQTHFTNRDHIEMANVSASRYFCTQCHVSQKEVRPLVDNEFEAVKALQ